MPDFLKIFQQANEMQGRLQKIQEELEKKTVTGSAGGGLVSAEVTGKGQLRSVKIDPSVVNPADVEMLEDLVTVAIGEAQKKAEEEAKAEMAKFTGGLDLPFKLPF